MALVGCSWWDVGVSDAFLPLSFVERACVCRKNGETCWVRRPSEKELNELMKWDLGVKD